MTKARRRTALLVVAAALAGLVALVVGRAPVSAPAGEGRQPSGSPATGVEDASTPRAAIPAVDGEPWNGVVWQDVAVPFEAADAHPTSIDGVLTVDDTVIGWGRAAMPDRNEFHEMGAIFVSPDGRRWRTILIDHGVAPPDTSEIHGVAAGPGGLIAFGRVCCARESLAVWHSPDGAGWTRLELDGELRPGAYINAVAGSPTGWVAVGSVGDAERQARIWTSPDGATWTAVDSERAGLGIGTVSDVASAPDGVIAVGTIDDEAGTHDGGVWISTDGLAWERVGADDPLLADAEETELWTVTPFAGGVFVTGNYGSREDRARCEELRGALASTDSLPPSPQTATSCGWGREHHWISVDGTEWERVDPAAVGGRAPIEFRNLVAGGPGIVLVGEENLPPSPDPGVWTSADGRSWQPVAAARPLPPDAFPLAIAIRGREIILAAQGAGDAHPPTVEIRIGEVR